MSLKATIHKATLSISDLNRHYYAEHALTIAQHPSETDERMMARILAFACHANEELAFTRGLSTDDEPEIWQKDPTGHTLLWIELGQPSLKRIQKACPKADQVVIYNYGGNTADMWWKQHQQELTAFNNLQIYNIDFQQGKALAALAGRNMELHVTIDESHIGIGDQSQHVDIQLEHRLGSE